MNRIYRNIWSSRLGCFVTVSEIASARGKSSGVTGALLASVLLSSSALAQVNVDALPTNGSVVAGQANISVNGSEMTVNQASSRAAINWQNFNIGSNATVQFNQPDASSVMLNRVVGTETSVIDGALRANGQVWLVNPNGVLFNTGARVDVGGLVASTRDISNADFMSGRSKFHGSSTGEINNKGTLTATDGGYIALIGKAVRNDGVISARLGSVAAVAGNKVTLNFGGDSLVGVAIDEGALNALIENGGAVRADGGQIMLTAKTASSLVDAVVNNTGEVRAQTIANKDGRILLLSDMDHGTLSVAGTLDASAPQGGKGGFIETSASHVTIQPSASITTRAVSGEHGKWLIDPTDFTVAASGGDMTGATLSSSLANGSVQIQSTSGASGNGGAVIVNDAVTWSANTTLTLDAQGSIKINAPISASGTSGKVFLKYGQATPSGDANTYSFGLNTSGGFSGRIDLQDGQNFSTKLGSTGPVLDWTVISSLGAASSVSGYDLQGINGALGARYVLGADIDASATSSQTFTPIGSSNAPFTGALDGLGHTISNLTINSPSADEVGLFGRLSGKVSNLTLSNVDVTGRSSVGALAGFMNSANVSQVAVTGVSITGDSNLGMIAGRFGNGSIANSYAENGTVTSTSATGTEIGGLVGLWENPPTAGTPNSFYDMGSTVVTVNLVDKSAEVTLGGVGGTQFADWLGGKRSLPASRLSTYFTQNSDGTWKVSTTSDLQNLLGFSQTGATTFKLDNDIDTSTIAGWRLPIFSPSINFNNKTLNLAIDQSYNSLVGLYGYSAGASNLNLTGFINGRNTVGGVTGYLGGSINNVTSSLVVNGKDNVGGLVGFAYGSGISDSSFSGTVTGNTFVGGLAGYYNGGVTNGTFSGTVNGTSAVGGLVGGINSGGISNANSTGTVNGAVSAPGGSIGGIAGQTYRTTVSNSVASGLVNGGPNGDTVGGLVGFNQESLVTLSTSTGAAVIGRNNVGGAVGTNSGDVTLTTSSRSVQAGHVVGGLVGASNGLIDQSSATGAVTATGDSVGGLLGSNGAWGGRVTNSSATGAVTGRTRVGGLVGYNENSWTALSGRPVTNSWSSGDVTGSGTDIGGLIGLWYDPAAVINSHYDVDAVTVTVNGQNRSEQVTLGGIYGTQYADWQGGNRTVLNPSNYFGAADSNSKYALSSTQNLKDVLAFAGDSTLSFRLANDIDVSSLAGWRLPFLAASLSGESNLISGLNTQQSWNNFGGLIGYLTGSIDSLAVTGVAAGHTYVGGMAGLNRGSISNSYTVVDVAGSRNVGGMVGLNTATGSVADTYASGSVTGTNGAQMVGGLVGANGGTVSTSYAQGNVQCMYCWAVGGLIGNGSGSDTNGANATGNATGNFWNMNATGMTSSAGGAGVTGLSSADMKSASNFVGAGWNASLLGGSQSTWRLYDGAAAPLLRSFLTAYTVTANSGTRTYDGTTDAFGVTYSSVPDSHVLGTLANVASGKDVGTWSIDPSGLYSDQRGYDILTVAGTAVITPKMLTSNNDSVASKIYDGNNTAALNLGTVSGLVGNETLNVSGSATFDSANAGQRTATVNYTLADGTNGGLASNYVLAPNNISGTITPKVLTATGTTASNKVYDGTANASGTAGTLSGLVGNETLDVANVSGTFDSVNAGQRTATLNYNLANGSNGGLASNYVVMPVAVSGAITPKALTAIGTTALDKVYDGTANASVTSGALSGLVGSETLDVAGISGTFDSINAGQRTATVNYTLANGSNGGLASNYVLAPVAVSGTITPKALTAVGTRVSNKVYDGTVNANVIAGMLSGLVGNETLNVAGTSGTFDSVNAGQRTATVNYTLTDGSNGGLASNYVLTPVSVSGTITPKALTAVGTRASNKVYDGTANADVSAGTLSGFIGAETLNVARVSGTFDSANAGKRIATVSYTLADGSNGGLASNYMLGSVDLDASISPKALTIVGSGARDKYYDGSQSASINIGTLNGLVGNEKLQISAVGNFDSAEPGERKATASYTLGDGTNGGKASNYVLAEEAGLTAKILAPGSGDEAAIENARTVAQQPFVTPELPIGLKDSVLATMTRPNVVALPTGASSSLSLENSLTLLSAPRIGEFSEAVPLSAARDMLGVGGMNGNVASGRDVRVPVGRNTLAEIVNGGVRLPSGVDQLLFVVADGNGSNGNGNSQSGKHVDGAANGFEGSDGREKRSN